MIHSLRCLTACVSIFFCSFLSSTQADDLKIGISIPLSASLGEYGIAVKNGLEMARKDYSELFKKIRFIYEDNRYSPKISVTTFNKLVNLDRVNIVFVWGNEPGMAIAPLAEKRKIPTIIAGQFPALAVNRKYVIRFLNRGDEYSRVILEHIRKQGAKKIGIVKSELTFFNMLVDGLRKHKTNEESIKIIDTFLPSEYDFRTVITSLKHENYDIIGVYLVPPQVIEFYQQAAELKLDIKTFGATPFESKTVIERSSKLMEGAVYSHNIVSQKFRERYIKAFGDDIQIAYAANAYEFARLTASLFANREKIPSSTQILAAYTGVEEQDGVTGPYRFKSSSDGDRYFEFDIRVKKIAGGKVVVLPSNKELTKRGRSQLG